MSDLQSALANASFDGIARVREQGLQGMITLRGDFAAPAVKKAATAASGTAMPGQRKAVFSDTGGMAWMSPDELLILCPYAEVTDRLAALTTALAGTHALAVNVSDARAMFEVSGPHAREVVAKLCPVDLSPQAFAPGDFRRTRMAQVAAAIWADDDQTLRIICFRSVARYVFGVLSVAAQKCSEVGYFQAG